VPIAGAMAARTKRIRFNTDICLLPFNHPIRLAEDLAVLDNLSNGRVEIGCGMGYAPHEFRGFRHAGIAARVVH
jgi:alkanesulfonate monooxygenase SsuD/methylene tetrahydromethanopterin reductase-like flavin-dependent oxidoreductase (luciferase family)